MKDRLPIFAAISIQTNSSCNLRCRFCFYGQYADYGSDEIIETQVIRKLFVELAAIGFRGRLSLYNLNDPLTDDRLLGLLRLARSVLPECFHFLSTNGMLLDQSLLDAVMDQVDLLRVNNYGHLPELDLRSPKVDWRDKRGFLAYANTNRGGRLAGLPAAGPPGVQACANPFGHLVIMPPGVAVLCCSDGFKELVLGDLRHQSLVRVWHGQELTTIRTLLAQGRRSEIPLCRACSVNEGGFYEYFHDPERFRAVIERFKCRGR